MITMAIHVLLCNCRSFLIPRFFFFITVTSFLLPFKLSNEIQIFRGTLVNHNPFWSKAPGKLILHAVRYITKQHIQWGEKVNFF